MRMTQADSKSWRKREVTLDIHKEDTVDIRTRTEVKHVEDTRISIVIHRIDQFRRIRERNESEIVFSVLAPRLSHQPVNDERAQMITSLPQLQMRSFVPFSSQSY